jgi:hypothetical protein
MKPQIVRKILEPLAAETTRKRINSLGKSMKLSLLKSLMFIGKTFLDWKTPKMHSNKLSSCLSDSLKSSKAAESHGLGSCSMDHQVLERLTWQKLAQLRLKARSFRSLRQM